MWWYSLKFPGIHKNGTNLFIKNHEIDQGAAGSVVVSQLQGRCFDHVHVGVLWVLQFPLTSQKHAVLN